MYKHLNFFLVSLFLYFLPVTLILIGIIPFYYRFHILVLAFICAIIYSWIKKYSLLDLGFKSPLILGSITVNGLLSLLILLVLFLFYFFGVFTKLYFPDWSLFYIFYLFFSAPVQTFLYRSLLFAEMEKTGIKSSWLQVITATIYYTYLHIIYQDFFTLFITAVIGLIWASLYFKYKDFWGIAISHSVLGAVTIFLGII